MTTILAVPGPSSTWAAMSPRILPCGGRCHPSRPRHRMIRGVGCWPAICCWSRILLSGSVGKSLCAVPAEGHFAPPAAMAAGAVQKWMGAGGVSAPFEDGSSWRLNRLSPSRAIAVQTRIVRWVP